MRGDQWRVPAAIVAFVAWATSVGGALGFLPTEHLGTLAVGVGVSSSLWLMVTRYQRPLGQAYELGYGDGRRDAVRAFNGGPNGGGRVTKLEDHLAS